MSDAAAPWRGEAGRGGVMGRGAEPLTEAELERLYAEVARRVAKRIRARIIR